MIHFEGEWLIPQPIGHVAACLTDAGYLVNSLTNIEAILQAEPDRARWKVRPKLGFLTGSLEITADVVERQPGQSVRLRMLSKAVGASSTVEATMQFAAIEGGTRVRWQADVIELTGLLKLTPRGLIQGAAARVIEETWAAVRQRIEAGPTGG